MIGAIKSFSITMMLANASALLLPLAIAAIIFFLALLAEDIYVFTKGGESFIGFFDKWLTKMAETSEVAGYFNGVLEVVAGFWTVLRGMFTGNGSLITEGFRLMFGDLVGMVRDEVNALIALIPAPLRKGFSALGGLLSGPVAGSGWSPAMAGYQGMGFSTPESIARPAAVSGGGSGVVQNFNAQVAVQAVPGATAQDLSNVRRAAEEGATAALRREAQLMKQNHPEVD